MLGKYRAFKTCATRVLGNFSNLHPYFAKSTSLNNSKFLNSNSPSTFFLHIVSHDIQLITSFDPYLHQNLRMMLILSCKIPFSIL